MKSFATSAVLHVALLSWGMWTFGEPRPLDMTQGESLPVEIVAIEEFSQAVMGEREAELTDTPAPTPTQTPETLPMPADNVGDNEVDLATPPRPEAAPRERLQTATAEAPPPPPPPPAPEPEPEPVVEPEPEPQPAEPEIAEPAPAPETVIDEAAPQVAQAEPEPAPEPAAPQNVPAPQARPTPPVRQAEPARETPPTPTPERQESPRELERQTADSQSAQEPEFDADEIAALLNRENSAGGGAQRSDAQASLGASRTTGERLTQSELDALRAQIQRCWSPPAGVSEAGSLRISIQMALDPSGELQGMPQIVSGGGGGSTIERVAGEAAVRAVRRCAPYNLPAEKYDTWSQVQINFDPSEMF